MRFIRDLTSMGMGRAVHLGTARPIWLGPIPDRYYYVVRNVRSGLASWVVPFSHVEKYKPVIRQILCIKNGSVSLIESDIPFSLLAAQGKMLSHSKVDSVRSVLLDSHDRISHVSSPSGRKAIEVKGRNIDVDGEVFI